MPDRTSSTHSAWAGGAALEVVTRGSLCGMEACEAGSGATRGNHGVMLDCAGPPLQHHGWYPKGRAGAAEEGALLVGATGDSPELPWKEQMH